MSHFRRIFVSPILRPSFCMATDISSKLIKLFLFSTGSPWRGVQNFGPRRVVRGNSTWLAKCNIDRRWHSWMMMLIDFTCLNGDVLLDVHFESSKRKFSKDCIRHRVEPTAERHPEYIIPCLPHSIRWTLDWFIIMWRTRCPALLGGTHSHVIIANGS